MKLEKYEDKSKKKRKVLLISLGVIVLVSISLLLYKTFAVFNEHVEFPMMKGKVDYFGNSDIYFVFYKGDELLNEMPQKDNVDNIGFDHAECTNDASIEWNEEEWAPLVKGLNKVKTKCSLYFKEQEKVEIGGTKVSVAESGDGLYKVEHNDLAELGTEWNKTEYRYAGVNPDNYVSFNNELWRIIGLVNVKIGNSVEQRVKIVRTDGVGEQKNFGNYYWDTDTNNWTTSKLKDMLNGIYYESEIGECYKGSSASQCDFNTGTDLPKGLDETARNMIDTDVIWTLGGTGSYDNESNGLVKHWYEYERGTRTGSSNTYPSEWSKETDVGEKHNGIGLIYPSDYGYATNGGSIGREKCFAKELYNWDSTSGNYNSECGRTDWLKLNGDYWTLSTISSNSRDAFRVDSSGSVLSGNVSYAVVVEPVGYLTPSTKIISGEGTMEQPFQLSVQ